MSNVMQQVSFAQKNPDELSASAICCDSISIETNITENCCLEITVRNPYCYDINVYFEMFNTNTGNYDVKRIEYSNLTDVSYIMCPESRENSLSYRIRIARSTHYEPACLVEWSEGFTEYYGEEDLTNCCNCPENSNDWFNVTIAPDLTCPDTTCRLQHNLNIPESITCFQYYEYDDFGRNVSNSGIITPNFINNFNVCIPFGQNVNITLTLKRSIDDENPCVLTATGSCDTTNYEEPINDPCVPDCFDTPFLPPEFMDLELQTCPGCIIRVYYTWRKACFTYQDLQILKIQLLTPACNNCSMSSIYKEALVRIIQINPMNFDPKYNNDSCSTIWRIVQGECWASWISMRWVTNGETSYWETITEWELCDSSECCLQPLTVCRYSWGIRIIPGQMINEVDTCINIFSTNMWGDTVYCEPKCEWLLNLTGDYNYIQYLFITNPHDFEMTSLIFNNIADMIGIKTSITSTNLNIYVRSLKTATIEVKIYDILGNFIINMNNQILKGENRNSVDISNLISGIYVYSIFIDGKNAHTGKISVIK
jgi:hypothetical protein